MSEKKFKDSPIKWWILFWLFIFLGGILKQNGVDFNSDCLVWTGTIISLAGWIPYLSIGVLLVLCFAIGPLSHRDY